MNPSRSLSFAAVVATFLGTLAINGVASAQCTGWEQVEAVGPSLRSSHAMAFDSARGTTLLYGGYGPKPDGSEYLGDLWEYNGSTWSLRSTSGPAPRQNAALAFDSTRNRLVLFGGFAHNSGPITYGQTWEWNGSAWSTVSTTGPSPRYLHAMAYDAARQQTVLFGGLADGAFRDSATWTWNGSTWTQAAPNGPSARFGTAMAYDAARQRVVLFGGFGGANPTKVLLRDTWEWNGTQWNYITSVGPSPRQFHSMAYDSARQRIVLMGGRDQSGTTLNDQWEWDGSTWVKITDTGPSGRESAAMTFDSVRQKLIVAGGFSERGRFGDAWERSNGSGSLPVITVSPNPTTGIPGRDVVLTGDAVGSGSVTFQWLRNGSAIVDSPQYSGTTTNTLTIFDAQPSISGHFSLRATNGCGSVVTPAVTVDVHCPADIDNGTMTGTRDGGVEISDILAFILYFEQGDIRADIDNGTGTGTLDGGVDINDILFFLVRYELGC